MTVEKMTTPTAHFSKYFAQNVPITQVPLRMVNEGYCTQGIQPKQYYLTQGTQTVLLDSGNPNSTTFPQKVLLRMFFLVSSS